MSQMIVKCVTCSGTGMREENNGRITTCDVCGGNGAKSISIERVAKPTPKQSDMERQLRLLLTWNQNNMLTNYLDGMSHRDGGIARLVADQLKAIAR
jgi:hypothetical protein